MVTNVNKEKSKKEKSKIELVNEMFGKDFLPSEENETVRERISSGIVELDNNLGGSTGPKGWPVGKVIEVFGPEQSGKSTLVYWAIAEAQKNGEITCIIDAEHAHDKIWLKTNGVVCTNEIKNPCKIYVPELSAEDILEKTLEFIRSGLFKIIAIDSTASLIPLAELNGEIKDQGIGQLARVMSKALRIIVAEADKTGTTVFFINQLRDKPSIGYSTGETETTPGGRALKFYSSIRLRVRAKTPKKDEHPEMFENGVQIGHILVCTTKKNKTFPPNLVCEIPLLYKRKRITLELISEGVASGKFEISKNQKKFTYMGETHTLGKKGDYEELILWLNECKLLIPFLVSMGVLDFTEFIKCGDVSQEDFDEYIEKFPDYQTKLTIKEPIDEFLEEEDEDENDE